MFNFVSKKNNRTRFKTFFWLLFIISIFAPSAVTLTSSSSSSSAGSQMPDFTQEDFEAMQQQVMAEISKLPEDEQKKIFEEAARIAEKMEKAIEAAGGEAALNAMSEKELMDFFGKIMEEEERELKERAAAEQKPAAEVKPTEPTVKVDEKAKSAQDKMADTIQIIINRIEAFLLKTQSIPDFSESVYTWHHGKKLTEWPDSIAWSYMKGRIERFNTKLHKIIDRDPKTKQYRYMKDAFENESLRNNLSHLSTILVQAEPQVNPEIFGLHAMGSGTEKAAIQVLNTLGEALFKLKVDEALNTIFDKYEPEAKKIREKQEEEIKRAEQESKKARPVSPLVSGGTAPQQSRVTQPRALEDNGYESRHYQPSSQRYSAPSDRSSELPQPIRPEGSTAKPSAAGSDKKEQAKSKDVGKEGKKEGDAQKKPDAKAEKPVSKEALKLELKVDEVTDHINTAEKVLSARIKKLGESTPSPLKNHMTYFPSTTPFNLENAKQDSEVIQAIHKELQQAKTKLEKIKDALEKSSSKKELEKTFSTTFEKAKSLKKLVADIDTILDVTWKQYSPEKQYVYFGTQLEDVKIADPKKAEEFKATADTLKAAIPEPVSLKDIAAQYKDLEKATKNL